MLPTHCDNCCSRGKWERTRNNQECIVVTTLGTFQPILEINMIHLAVITSIACFADNLCVTKNKSSKSRGKPQIVNALIALCFAK